jgi:choline/glycine/proline betaine transport protein
MSAAEGSSPASAQPSPPLPPSANGEDPPRIRINGPVFYPSAIITLVFVLFGTFAPQRTTEFVDILRRFVVEDFGWFYVAAVAGFMVFVLYLAFSRYGSVKLGPDDSEPEYSYISWFAMLFSAGMGVGLLFFGVAEPLSHYGSPPTGEGGTAEAAQQALMIAAFHWGSHAWAIVLILGLSLGYFTFRRGEPCTVRYALRPLIGKRVDGPLGYMVDVFAAVGTIFGVATTLGLGVLQADVGLDHLLGIGTGVMVQITVMAIITGCAVMSVAAGMDKGIKRLSELNVILAIALMLFVMVTGPTVLVLKSLIQNVGAYLAAVVPRTMLTYAYEPNSWMADWTLFYWAWGIAWSPFVGMFIARISRGRTIREFVLGVLLVPAVVTFVWLAAFGNTAIWMDRSGAAPMVALVSPDALETGLFVLLDHLPLASISGIVATALILSYSVTTADSGALVIDTITSGDAEDTPAWQRVFWAIAVGAIAGMLLFAGGLDAIQMAVTVIALPFGAAMIFLCWGLARALQAEKDAEDLDAADQPKRRSWQQRLSAMVHVYDQAAVKQFLTDTALPALETMAEQMRASGMQPDIADHDGHVALTIHHQSGDAFRYVVRSRSYRPANFNWTERRRSTSNAQRHYRAMAYSNESGTERDVTEYSQDMILHDVLNRYSRFRAKHLMP